MMVLSDAYLVRSFRLRPRVALKRELQRLLAEHDAVAAFLWTAAASGDKALSIESVGDREARPRSHNLQGRASSICDQRVLRSFDREDRAVVLLYSKLCMDAPTLILGLVEPGAPFTDILVADLEQAIVRIESIIVDVLDPPAEAPSSQKRAPRARTLD